MATFTEKNLARQAINNTGETIYTVPASTVGIVKDIHICNNSTTDCYVTLWLVPNGASKTNENIFFYQWEVPAKDFIHWTGYQILETPGDTIQALSETTDQITLTISGAEIT